MPARGFLNRSAERWGDRPALIFDDHSLSYRKLADIVRARRQSLGLSAPREGDSSVDTRVDGESDHATTLTPRPDDESLVDILAYWSSNEPFALLHPGWTDRERRNADTLLRSARLHRGDIVFFTSGTTGLPKGVIHTRESLFAGATAVAEHFELTPSDRWFSPLSLAHVGGFTPVLRALMAGGALILPSQGGARTLRGPMLAHEPTITSLVPSMLRALLRDPAVPSLRLVMIGGDALNDDDLILAEARGYPIVPTYGMTETGAAIIDLRTAQALGAVSIRAGEDGVLSVRGPSLFRGYLRESGVETPFDKDGWFATLDRGRVSNEGEVVVYGRLLQSFITTGGETVDANEIEAVFLNMPGVNRAIVVGVPDAEWGRIIGAVLCCSDDGAAHELASVDSVRDYCRERLASHKRPRLLAVLGREVSAPHDASSAVAFLLAHGIPVTYR